MWAVRAIVFVVLLFGGAYGFSAQKAWEAEQARKTEIEHERRLTVLREAKDRAEERAEALSRLNKTLLEGAQHAASVSRLTPNRACLDAGSVRALDAVRRPARR